MRRRLTSPRSRERPFSVQPGWNRVGAHWAVRGKGAGLVEIVGGAYGGRGRTLWEQWAGREEGVGQSGGNKGGPVGNRGRAV